MRVLFAPDFSHSNPYQRLLAENLARFGIRVRMAGRARRLPKAGDGDILHIHWTHPFILARTRLRTAVRLMIFLRDTLVARRRGVPLVWTVHNLWSHERPFPILEMIGNRWLSRLSDEIVVHCEDARERVIKTYGIRGRRRRKVSVIPHGHYLGAYPDDLSRDAARRRLGLEEGNVVFLFLGRVRSYKGVLPLVEAFRSMDMTSACLVIAGRPETDQLAERVESLAVQDGRIKTHLRFLEEQELQLFFRASDVVVTPYSDVLTSGAVVLAMSFGKPVVASRVGCTPETLDPAGAFLYDPADPRGLEEALRQAADSEELSAMGERNRNRAQRLMGWARISEELAEVYRSAVERGPS